MNGTQVLHALGYFAPETALTVLILMVIIGDLVFKTLKAAVPAIALAGSVLVLAMICQAWQHYPLNVYVEFSSDNPLIPHDLFGGAVVYDRFSLFFKGVFMSATIVVLLFAMPVISKWQTGRGEVYALILSCALGMCFMAAANDLLMMYLALEFVSITSYILAGFLRKNRKSSEASLKYILYGAAASGLMIYGMSYLYGITGTLDLQRVGLEMARLQPPHTITLVISTLIMAGFGYKIAAAPFHMWCPDVYEGAPTPVTAFFSVGPKAAGFAMLIRFVDGIFPPTPNQFDIHIIMAVLAVLTLTIGNLGALQQSNLKRLLAYSSIGHAGIMLLALTIMNGDSVFAVTFYTAVYVVMNLGAFLLVIVMEEQFGIETVEQCKGLGWRAPGLGVMMTVFMISLTGLPPTAGFLGKLFIFRNLVQQGWPKWGAGEPPPLEIALAVIGVLFSVVALFYYARVIAAMYLQKPDHEGPWLKSHPLSTAMAWVLAVATIGLGLFPGPLMALAQQATQMSPR